MSETSSIHEHGLDAVNRVIYLQSFNDGGTDAGVDHRVAGTFIKNMSILEKEARKPITIQMHLTGGEWGPGMAIFDSIRQSPCRTTIVAKGQAESMSSIILQAAGHRVVSRNCYFMSHFGSAYYEGDAKNLKNMEGWLKQVNDTMFDIYLEGLLESKWAKEKYGEPTERQVRSFLNRKMKDGDWYLFGNDIVHYGFADEVK